MKAAFKMNVTTRTAKLFLQGEEEATAIVYQSYRALLYFIIATYVNQKDDCDDVYQNVFMKILEKRSEVKDASSLHSYLCAMAKNEAIDFAKKRSREQSSDLLEEICADKQDSQLDYFLPYDLSKEEKKIIGYRLTFSLSWKEISEMLDIPAATAKYRYAQAIKKIKGVYKDEKNQARNQKEQPKPHRVIITRD